MGLAAAVAIAAALDLFVALRPDGDPLSNEAMGAARTAVKSAQKTGDLIVHSPLFRMSELQALGDLPSSAHVPAPKLRETRRILVIDRKDHPIFGLGEPAQTIDIEGSDHRLELKIYEPKGVIDVPLYALKESIQSSTMHVERPAGTVKSRCTQPRSEGGFSCPGEPEWLYVAKRSLRVGNEEVECVWAHPTTGGVIVFTIPAQSAPPAGRRLVLDFAGGFNDDAVRMTGDGAAVRADIMQKGESRGTVSAPNRVGWARSRVNVDPGEPIELRFSTPNDGRRHYCVNAELLEIAQ